jgi:hypothetical protein
VSIPECLFLRKELTYHYRQPTSYVSPSDDIMSPCTKKLSDIKGKRFKKYVISRCLPICLHLGPKLIPYSAGKPQSLFAKLGKKSYEQSSAEQARTEN